MHRWHKQYVKLALTALIAFSVTLAIPSDHRCFTELSSKIGALGGKMTITAEKSPISGITITFPAVALTQETSVSLGYCHRSIRIYDGHGSDIFLLVDAGVKDFKEPVTVDAAYDKSMTMGYLAIPYLVDDDGKLHVAQISAKPDPVAPHLRFDTFRTGVFTWIYKKIGD